MPLRVNDRQFRPLATSFRGTSRRAFLRTALAVAGGFTAPPVPFALAEEPSLAFAPAVFEVTATSALVWICGRRKQQVRIVYSTMTDFSDARFSVPIELPEQEGLIAAFDLSGLQPDTRYQYRVVAGDATSATGASHTGEFRTAPVTRRDFVFAFSGDNDARLRPFRLFDVIAGQRPEFFIHLGDTMYAGPRGAFRPVLSHYRAKHAEVRADSHLQAFLSKTPCFAIWDDNEVEDDFFADHPGIPDGRKAFREYWPCRTASTEQLYRNFRWGPEAEFFVIDARQYRSPPGDVDAKDRTMLGDLQKEWLKSALKESRATFKFLCSSVPFHHPNPDKWGGFRAERGEIVQFIRQEKIGNVIVLSADIHLAADLSNPNTGLKELVVGPIAARPNFRIEPANIGRWASRNQFHIGDEYNFGVGKVIVSDGNPRVELQVIDTRGQSRYRVAITASTG